MISRLLRATCYGLSQHPNNSCTNLSMISLPPRGNAHNLRRKMEDDRDEERLGRRQDHVETGILLHHSQGVHLAVKNQSHLLTDAQQPCYYFRMLGSAVFLVAWLLDLQTNGFSNQCLKSKANILLCRKSYVSLQHNKNNFSQNPSMSSTWLYLGLARDCCTHLTV